MTLKFDYPIYRLKDGTTRIDVLDKGYVRLVDTMGNDLTVANAAKVSFDKEATEVTDREKKLLDFLWREGHTSPYRHAMLAFEVYAPLFVARQWWKYVIGSDHIMDAWNESSRRYITENNKFYLPKPTEWRAAPENRKQGSGGFMELDETTEQLTYKLLEYQELGEQLYQEAMDAGAAPEQARLFLPAYGLYVRWRWTSSLQGVMHFLQQRLEHDAQYEIQQYASAVFNLSYDKFQHSIAQVVQ